MISYPFPPNASAGAVRSERFARYLPQFGWAVEVITIKQRKDMFGDIERLANLGRNVKVNFTHTLDPWLWLKDKKPRNIGLRAIRSVLMRIFSFPDHMFLWVPFAVKKGLEVCRMEKIDAIYSTSPPHSTHLSAQILSMLTGKPWVADFRDPWTLNAYRDKGWIEQGLLKIERVLEKSVLRNASLILANTKANRRNLLEAFPFLPEAKVVHLPNGWEEFPSEFHPIEKKDGPLTIVHAGTFYPRFKPYGLFYALAAWRDGKSLPDVPPLKNGDIKVILLGARDEETATTIRKLGIGELVEVRPWVSMDEARKVMCQADLLWASLGTGKQSSTYLPSKLFEYIAARKPIIGFFPEGEAERLIRETAVGTVFTSDDLVPIIEYVYDCVNGRNGGRQIEYTPNIRALNSRKVENIVKRMSGILNRICK